MLHRRRVRLRTSGLVGFTGFTVVFVPSALLFAGLVVAGLNIDRTIGVAGAMLALGAFAVSQYQSRHPPTRRIVFLAKSRSTFARNIFRGLTDGLQQYADIHVAGVFPEEGEDPSEFQLRWLRSIETARAHGIVLIPATEDHHVWHDLARIMRTGTVVVCVDTKPPNQHFRERGIAPPLFVGSDFTAGGRLVGRYLARELVEMPDARLVVATGPESSWPARERVSWILYELGTAGLLDRCTAVELADWNATTCAEKLLRVIDTVADNERDVLVFAGNDKLALELDRQIDRQHSAGAAGVRLIGYDGTTTDDGTQLLGGLDRALATVDAVPVEQGRAAAEFIACAYEGHVTHITKRIVQPHLIDLGKRAVSNPPRFRTTAEDPA